MGFIDHILFWYAERPQIVWSILLPAIISLGFITHAFLRHGLAHLGASIAVLIVASAVGFEWSFWREGPPLVDEGIGDVITLHMIQVPFIMVASLIYLDIPISPGYAYAMTFFSNLFVDFMQSIFFHPYHQWLNSGFMDSTIGIGGGGFVDALFLYPLISAILVIYGTKRRSGWKNKSMAG